MFKQIFNEEGTFILLTALCMAGIIMRIVLCIWYRHLIRQSADMDKSSNKAILDIKKKFESEYQKNYGISNVKIFADKYMYEMKCLGLKLATWETVGTITIMLCVLVGSMGAYYAFSNQMEQTIIFTYVLEGIIAGVILVVIDVLVNAQHKKEHIHVNVCNYLENHMKPCIENGEYNYEINNFAKLSDEIDAGMLELINSMDGPYDEDEADNVAKILTTEEQKIVEDVIREYLT